MPNEINLTPAQFEAVITEAAKGVVPAELKPMPLGKRLAPHRKVLKKLRTDGYSAQQLANFLRHPKIGIEVSPSFIRKFLLVQHRDTTKSPAPVPRGAVKYTAVIPPKPGV